MLGKIRRMQMERTIFETELREQGYGEVLDRRMEGDAVNPEHAHEFDARLLVLEGAMTITSEGSERTYRAGARRYPPIQPDRGRVAARFARQPAQFLECRQRRVAGRISQRHEAVAVFRRPTEGRLGVAAEPDRHPAPIGPWARARVDAGVL